MLRTFGVFLLLCVCFSAAQAQTVVCFGDSLTAGAGAPPGSAYPDFLRKDLAEAGYQISIINQGVNGDSTKEGLARLGVVLRVHPSIVVLEFGANDALYQRPLPEIRQNLSAIIETLQQAHIQVLLAGIDVPANLGFTPPPQLTTPYSKQFYAIYPALAEKYSLPVLPFLLQGVYGVEGLMSPDYLHPNSLGYKKVAANVLPYLEKMLSK